MTTRITTENITDATIGTADLASSVPLNTQWQAVFVGDGSTGLTAVAGRGYFINTTSGTATVTLPGSPSAGDVVVLKDYARTWGTNAVSIASALFDGVAGQTPFFSTEGQTVTLVYMDGTKGWSLVNEDTTTDLGVVYVTATGGTITTVDTDYKVHTFTGDGCFVVSNGGNPTGSNTVDYVIIAGGGGGGGDGGGGGGAGGFRLANSYSIPAPTMSPLSNPTAVTASVGSFPIVIGGGGTAGTYGSPSTAGTPGVASSGLGLTSAGGGAGGLGAPGCAGENGGSGGGGTRAQPGGTGNTPPVSPPQGNNGGTGPSTPNGDGGGGAGAAGTGASGPPSGGPGGIGSFIADAYFGPGAPSYGEAGPVSSTRYLAAGGGGGGDGAPSSGGTGGTGGGGNGGARPNSTPGTGGTINTGSGGGGAGVPGNAGAGGSGIILIRYKFQ